MKRAVFFLFCTFVVAFVGYFFWLSGVKGDRWVSIPLFLITFYLFVTAVQRIIECFGYGKFAATDDLPKNEIFSVIGEPIYLGDDSSLSGYAVVLKSRTGKVRVYRFKGPPPSVFQVCKFENGRQEFAFFPPVSTTKKEA